MPEILVEFGCICMRTSVSVSVMALCACVKAASLLQPCFYSNT